MLLLVVLAQAVLSLALLAYLLHPTKGRTRFRGNASQLSALSLCASIILCVLFVALYDTRLSDIPAYVANIAESPTSGDDRLLSQLSNADQLPFGWYGVYRYINHNLFTTTVDFLQASSWLLTIATIAISIFCCKSFRLYGRFYLISIILLNPYILYNINSQLRQGLSTTFLISIVFLLSPLLRSTQFRGKTSWLLISRNRSAAIGLCLVSLSLILVHSTTGLAYWFALALSYLLFRLDSSKSYISLIAAKTKSLLPLARLSGIAGNSVLISMCTVFTYASSIIIYKLYEQFNFVAIFMVGAGEVGASFSQYGWNQNTAIYPLGPSLVVASSVYLALQLLSSYSKLQNIFCTIDLYCAKAHTISTLFALIASVFGVISFALYPVSALSLRFGAQSSIFLLISIASIFYVSHEYRLYAPIPATNIGNGVAMVSRLTSSSIIPLLYILYSYLFLYKVN